MKNEPKIAKIEVKYIVNGIKKFVHIIEIPKEFKNDFVSESLMKNGDILQKYEEEYKLKIDDKVEEKEQTL